MAIGFSIQIDRKIAKLITDHATLFRYPDNMNEWTEKEIVKLGERLKLPICPKYCNASAIV